jgi:hypothetical protein
VFEIPDKILMGNRTAHHRTQAAAQHGHHKAPSNAFQIAAPGPIQRRIGYWNMGRFQAAASASMLPCCARNRPESRSGDPGKVNRFWLI